MFNSVVLILNVLLMCITMYLSYIVIFWMAKGKRWRKVIKNATVKIPIKSFSRETGSPGDIGQVNLTMMDKLQLKYIDRSGIARYVPFLSSKILLALCAVLMVSAFIPVFRIVRYIPSTVAISAMFSMIPIFTLDIMARYNSGKIRKSLAEFISVLSRWCAVKEDIFFAFEKSLESGLREPLVTYIRDMVIQVKRGIKPEEALEMLRLKVNNPQFGDFIINVKQNVKHRGDTRKLLSNLEEQFYRMEEEYNRRKISTFRDRVIIYILMFAVFFICYGFIRINPDVEKFYLETSRGRLLITVFCILYGLGFYVSLGISRYEH